MIKLLSQDFSQEPGRSRKLGRATPSGGAFVGTKGGGLMRFSPPEISSSLKLPTTISGRPGIEISSRFGVTDGGSGVLLGPQSGLQSVRSLQSESGEDFVISR